MKFCNRTKCWNFIATTNSLFFKKYSAIFRIVVCEIQSDHLFSLNCVNLYTNASICYFIFFISVLVIIFFNILTDFLANIFFLPYHVCKQFICIFRPCKQFFSIFLIPLLQKNNSPSLTCKMFTLVTLNSVNHRPFLPPW